MIYAKLHVIELAILDGYVQPNRGYELSPEGCHGIVTFIILD